MLIPYSLLGALKIFTKRCMLGPLQKHAVQPIINIDTDTTKKKKKNCIYSDVVDTTNFTALLLQNDVNIVSP